MTLRLRRPIFLLASERSGTNLLRVLLGRHPEIAAPPPAHLLVNFLPSLPAYGDLRQEVRFRLLCEHVVTSLGNLLDPWQTAWTVEELMATTDERSFEALFDAVYDREREALGGARVFFKENESFRWAGLLRTWYPEAHLIYMVRDGRDVLSSWLASPNHFGSLRDGAEVWSRQQRACLEVYQRFQDEGCVSVVYYEDLVRDPETTLRSLLEVLGHSYSPDLLGFHEDPGTQQAAARIDNWKHLAKPIQQQQVRLYRTRLSGGKVRRFEVVAFRELRLLGYELETSIDRLVRARRFGDLVGKAFLFLSKVLRFRWMRPAEARLRYHRVRVVNQMRQERDLALEPILRPRAPTR